MKKILFLIIFSVTITSFRAQVGINIKKPDPSAMLHINSNNKGVLFPQVQLESLYFFAPLPVAPPDNTIVFNIRPVGGKILRGYYIWKGDRWMSPAINAVSEIVAKYQADTDSSFNFNDSTTNKNIKVFNQELMNDDPTVFQVINPEELKILKSGTYLVTTNLGLQNTTFSASQAELYIGYYYGDVCVSGLLLTRVPQQRTYNIANKFNYNLSDYISVSDADVGKILTLKVSRRNTSDNDFITYDLTNFSSITIVRVSDAY